jgi:uncharacterized damage-inducible protein DinB
LYQGRKIAAVPSSGRPLPGEYADYAQADIDFVEGDDIVATLTKQRDLVITTFSIDEEEARGLAYAPGKWTLKEVLGHLCDDERIFAYRALCIARGDATPLPGFDENEYMAGVSFESRPLADVVDEYRSVRGATLTLFASMTAEAWLRRGTVNEYGTSVRGLAFHIAGHELHHLRVVRDRYLVR